MMCSAYKTPSLAALNRVLAEASEHESSKGHPENPALTVRVSLWRSVTSRQVHQWVLGGILSQTAKSKARRIRRRGRLLNFKVESGYSQPFSLLNLML
jgi:hypothetical protein